MNNGALTSQRYPLLILGIISMAVAAGLLSATNPVATLLVLAGVVLCAAMLASMDVAILVLFLALTFVDAARKIVAFNTGVWSAWQLLSIDVVLILALVSLYGPAFVRCPRFRTPRLPAAFKFLVIFFIAWVFLELLNPTVPDWVLSLVGIHTYLLPMLAIGLGWYICSNWNLAKWRTAALLITIVVFVVVALGIYFSINTQRSANSNLLDIILDPSEHDVRSWGSEDLPLTSSIFASSKRLGRFLLMTYPLVYIFLKRQNRSMTIILTSLLFGLGCLVSGSREALLLFVFLFFFLENGIRQYTRIVPVITGVALIAFLVVGSDETQKRLEYTISSPEDWATRIDYMLILPVFEDVLNHPNPEDLFGLGAGRYGGQPLFGAQTEIGSAIETSVPTGRQYRNSVGVSDAGLFKLFVDLGLVGLAGSVALYLYLVILPWHLDMRNPMVRASAGVMLIWFVLFLKAYTVLNDPIMMVFYWIYVGVITGIFSSQRWDTTG